MNHAALCNCCAYNDETCSMCNDCFDGSKILPKDMRRKIMIEAAKMIYSNAQNHVKNLGFSDDAKVTAWDMQHGAAPILDELGMTWPEVLAA